MHKTARVLAALGAVLLGLAVAAPAKAQVFGTDPGAGLSSADQNVFFFGGPFHSNAFHASLAVPWLQYDGAWMVGAGYQKLLYRSDFSFNIFAEIGATARIDPEGPASAELFGGLNFRHDGLVFFDTFRVSPSITVGASVVSGTVGSETDRTEALGLDGAPFLVYLGPELAVTPVANPDIEGFFRVQHRSGGFGLIYNGLNGSNAVTLGLRYKF